MFSASTSALAQYVIPALFVAAPGTASIVSNQTQPAYVAPHAIECAWWSASEPTGRFATTDQMGSEYLTDTVRVASWLAAASTKVLSYASVQDGWKGDGSTRPTPLAIDEAIDLLNQFAFELPSLASPMISADEDGFVCFYWRSGAMMASISVYGDGTYSFYAEGNGKSSRSDEAQILAPLAADLLEAMRLPLAVLPTAA